jgi:hypothetical protein
MSGVSIHDRPRDPVHDGATVRGGSWSLEYHLAVFEASVQLEQKTPVVYPGLVPNAAGAVVNVEALA